MHLGVGVWGGKKTPQSRRVVDELGTISVLTQWEQELNLGA